MRHRLAALGLAALLGCEAEPPPAPVTTALGAAAYVGGAVCANCHMAEAAAWRGSHHDLAMQTPSPASVLGDFDDASFDHAGVTTRFSTRDGEYWVATDGPDGALTDFRVVYTFGVEPLQQYLLESPDGRLQALGIAWDSQPADTGGQRWFHLYPDDEIQAGDPLHWTGLYQNWNTMCAECHSTGLGKNYSAADASYATTWTSLDVDCEACHGPGSLHAAAPATHALALGRLERAWVLAPNAATASRVPAADRSAELDTCAQCHSRRTQNDDDFAAGAPYLDSFRPALLDAGLYHADGQILDEVYVYGSFLQSRMHAAGVTCSDCHEPHTAELRVEGNGLCTQCHRAETFDTAAHHAHEPGSEPAACVACHMPARTYMQVDPRRDHSFRVPRPDLSVELGTPNACNGCHADQTPAWAATAIEASAASRPPDHYGIALAAGRDWQLERRPLLEALIDDERQPAIARATALGLLAAQPDDSLLVAIEGALTGQAPLVQLAALEQLGTVEPRYRVDLAQRFLDAPLKSHRMAAARGLATARESLGPGRRRDLDAALAEYIEAQQFNADRPEALVNLGALHAELGRDEEAEAALRRAIDLAPSFIPSYVNLAELLRRQGRDSDARALLERAASEYPDAPALAVAYGFALVRSGDSAQARDWLRRAAELAPGDPYYAYVHGVALYSGGDTPRALDVLTAGHSEAPGYAELAYALATIHRDLGNDAESLTFARRTLDAAPGDTRARALLDELER